LKNGSAEWRLAVLAEAGQVRVNGKCTGAFAKNGDLGCVATKSVNVALYPGQGEALVKEAKVASGQRQLG
jgi:hypothetical protein